MIRIYSVGSGRIYTDNNEIIKINLQLYVYDPTVARFANAYIVEWEVSDPAKSNYWFKRVTKVINVL